MVGVVHYSFTGTGKLGENSGVVSALIDGEHRNTVNFREHHILWNQIGKGKGLNVRLALFTGTKTKFFDISRGLFFYQCLHNVNIGNIRLGFFLRRSGSRLLRLLRHSRIQKSEPHSLPLGPGCG